MSSSSSSRKSGHRPKTRPTKADNRKSGYQKHTTKGQGTKPPKGGRGGKGTWGNPMDDYKYMDQDSAPSQDPADPNYVVPDVGGPTEEDVEALLEPSSPDMFGALRTDGADKFQADIASLASFKVHVQELAKTYFGAPDVGAFLDGVRALDCPQFHNQVPKQLLLVALPRDTADTEACEKLLAALCDARAELVSRMQLESAFRRLFGRVHELTVVVPDAYDRLVGYASCSVGQGHVTQAFVDDLKAQTQLAKDAGRVARVKREVEVIVEEYFSSEELAEALRCVKELQDAQQSASFVAVEVVKRSVSMALDRDTRCRELTSQLLARAVGDSADDVVDRSSAALGFEILLQRVEDMVKDVPDILHLMVCFVARAIVDEALPPAFVDQVHLLESDMGHAVVYHARHLVHEPRFHQRLANVWGIASQQSVPQLKKAVALIIKEYLISEELNEAVVSVKELNVRMFHHEVVKQLVQAVADFTPPEGVHDRVTLEDVQQDKVKLAVDFVLTCVNNSIMDMEQVVRGFARVRERMPDTILDCPRIKWVYNQIAGHFQANGVPQVTDPAKAAAAAAPAAAEPAPKKGAAAQQKKA